MQFGEKIAHSRHRTMEQRPHWQKGSFWPTVILARFVLLEGLNSAPKPTSSSTRSPSPTRTARFRWGINRMDSRRTNPAGAEAGAVAAHASLRRIDSIDVLRGL